MVIRDINFTAIGDFSEALKLFNEVCGTEFDSISTPMETVVFSPNQIKSADPVTYDDNGEVIPLSERFDDTKTDIRYHKKVDKGNKSWDNVNRANKEGDFINDFHKALSRFEWKMFYNKVAEDGFLTELDIGTVAPIRVKNKLVVAERQYIGKDSNDFVVIDVFGVDNNDIDVVERTIDELSEYMMRWREIYGSDELYEESIRVCRHIDKSTIFTRYDTRSNAFVVDVPERRSASYDGKVFGDYGKETSGEGMLQKNQQFVQGTEGLPIKKQLKSYAVETDTELLAQHLEENSEAVGEILRRSSEIEMNEKTLTRLVANKLRYYGIYGSVRSETAENIALLLEVAKHPSVQGKDITADITDAIKSALERTDYSFNPNKEDYNEVVEILKGYGNDRVYLTPDQEAHVREQGYDLRWLRGQYFGKLNVVKASKFSDSNEIRLDDVYSDLSEKFPNIFPTEDSPSRRAVDSSEYAMDILDKLDYLSQGMSLTIEEAFGDNEQTVATRIMSEVVADVVQSKYNNRKNPYVDSVIVNCISI